MPKVKRPVPVSELICDALLRIIERDDKPYSEITVQDVVDEAGACRNSFYRNYSSLEDIFNKKFAAICSDSGTEIEMQEEYDYYDVFRSVCELYKKYKRFFKCYYKANSEVYFNTIISRVIASNTTQNVESLAPEDYYCFACRAWTGVGVITEWLNRDCDLSIEELTDIVKRFGLK